MKYLVLFEPKGTTPEPYTIHPIPPLTSDPVSILLFFDMSIKRYNRKPQLTAAKKDESAVDHDRECFSCFVLAPSSFYPINI